MLDQKNFDKTLCPLAFLASFGVSSQRKPPKSSPLFRRVRDNSFISLLKCLRIFEKFVELLVFESSGEKVMRPGRQPPRPPDPQAPKPQTLDPRPKPPDPRQPQTQTPRPPEPPQTQTPTPPDPPQTQTQSDREKRDEVKKGKVRGRARQGKGRKRKGEKREEKEEKGKGKKRGNSDNKRRRNRKKKKKPKPKGKEKNMKRKKKRRKEILQKLELSASHHVCDRLQARTPFGRLPGARVRVQRT